MRHERKGFKQGGAWVVELDGRRHTFEYRNGGFPEMDQLYLPRVPQPMGWRDYACDLMEGGQAKWLSRLGILATPSKAEQNIMIEQMQPPTPSPAPNSQTSALPLLDTTAPITSVQLPSRIDLDWKGPFAWFGRGNDSIFEGPSCTTAGVYVWTVRVGHGYRVFYVGQTEKGFAERHHQHFKEYFGGGYSIYEPGAFAEGRLECLYHGFAYRKPFWKNAIEFNQRIQNLIEPLFAHLRLMQLFIAHVPYPGRVQRRVESALLQAVYALQGPPGQLLERNLRIEPRRSDEDPIAVTQRPVGLLEGLPEHLLA